MANTACQLMILFGLLLIISVKPGQSNLPCTHPLRLSVPHLFRHCTVQPCTYSEYSDWQPVPNSDQSDSQCSSGKSYQERRTRTNPSSSCTDLTDTRSVCKPDQEDQLILALGLGGSGKNLNPITSTFIRPQILTSLGGLDGGGLVSVVLRPFRPSNLTQQRVNTQSSTLPKCPRNSNVGQVCSHLTGKRSVMSREEFSPAEAVQKRDIAKDSQSAVKAPIPFVWSEHGPRLRRSVQQCNSNDIQHVLFVLDSSGSIGRSSFQRMKDAIGKLVPLFCKKVKFAMITFSRHIYLEFCFNCFENTFTGRQNAKQAISEARYHSSMTYTGAATKCICDELLSSSCGINQYPSCLDVVYITDGQSNDPRFRVCNEVRCLHHRSGINTYAIGINNFNQAELDCISHSSNLVSAFQYNSFTEFEQSIEKIINRLVNALSSGNNYSCLERDRSINPVNAVPFTGR